MKYRSVTIAEIKESNPRLCLSTKRFLNKCFDCQSYQKCESRIENPELEAKLKKMAELKEQIKNMQQELTEMKLK